MAAARRAAALLIPTPGARILDIGSGAGKFCIVAAACFDARVRGVEQRGYLVDAAERAASAFGVDVTFEHATFTGCDAASIDGVYLFNPFAENLCGHDDRIDGTVELSEERFCRDLAATERLLQSANVGTRVVTYCGFGGSLPKEYALAQREQCGGTLELWIKRRARRT